MNNTLQIPSATLFLWLPH